MTAFSAMVLTPAAEEVVQYMQETPVPKRSVIPVRRQPTAALTLQGRHVPMTECLYG